MIPAADIIIPVKIIAYPLIVHSGLLYINDDVGPTTDLLCNINIVPSTINVRPIIVNVL